MLKSPWLKNLLKINNLAEILKRFALPVLCAIVITAILIGIIFEMFADETAYIIMKLSIALIAVFYALTALKLYAESNQWKNKKYFLFSIFSIVLVIALIIFNEDLYSIFLLSAGLFLSISIAPFLAKEDNNIAYCNFIAIYIVKE